MWPLPRQLGLVRATHAPEIWASRLLDLWLHWLDLGRPSHRRNIWLDRHRARRTFVRAQHEQLLPGLPWQLVMPYFAQKFSQLSLPLPLGLQKKSAGRAGHPREDRPPAAPPRRSPPPRALDLALQQLPGCARVQQRQQVFCLLPVPLALARHLVLGGESDNLGGVAGLNFPRPPWPIRQSTVLGQWVRRARCMSAHSGPALMKDLQFLRNGPQHSAQARADRARPRAPSTWKRRGGLQRSAPLPLSLRRAASPPPSHL
mmetsp:Transcript_1867/g.3049  ORF Transcript_1867/g.3049 Transcript_1867/m.3049 type:complete len:259 (-) Transcript_1867:308-1084(-)